MHCTARSSSGNQACSQWRFCNVTISGVAEQTSLDCAVWVSMYPMPLQTLDDWSRASQLLNADQRRSIRQLAFPETGLAPGRLPKGMAEYLAGYCSLTRDNCVYLSSMHLRAAMIVSCSSSTVPCALLLICMHPGSAAGLKMIQTHVSSQSCGHHQAACSVAALPIQALWPAATLTGGFRHL